jgi:hypothetical protein
MNDHDVGPATTGRQVPAARGKRKRKLTRRGFLGGVGAGGLAAATVAFGPARSAEALTTVGCCDLCRSSSGTQTQCENHSGHYEWYCSLNVGGYFYECTCCENNFTKGCNSVSQSYGICYD